MWETGPSTNIATKASDRMQLEEKEQFRGVFTPTIWENQRIEILKERKIGAIMLNSHNIHSSILFAHTNFALCCHMLQGTCEDEDN